VKQGNTQGVSPKAILAAALPAIATLIGVLGGWAASGEFDRPETVAAVTGLATSVLAFVGAYIGVPGTVSNVSAGPPSDDLLMADHDVRNRLTGPGIQTKRPG
jgi:hypothetical protein